MQHVRHGQVLDAAYEHSLLGCSITQAYGSCQQKGGKMSAATKGACHDSCRRVSVVVYVQHAVCRTHESEPLQPVLTVVVAALKKPCHRGGPA
jgi:hypothetical protein